MSVRFVAFPPPPLSAEQRLAIVVSPEQLKPPTKEISVRIPDGRVEDVRWGKGGYQTSRIDSLRVLLLVEQDAALRLCDEAPELLFAYALADRDGATGKTQNMTEILRRHGLSSEELRRLWSKCRLNFEALSCIHLKGSAPNVSYVVHDEVPLQDSVIARLRPIDAETAIPAGYLRMEPKPKVAVETETASAKTVESRATMQIDQSAHEVPQLVRYRSRPLELAAVLENLSPKKRTLYLAEASHSELQEIIPAVLCAQKPDLGLSSKQVVDWMREGGASAALSSAADELTSTELDDPLREELAQSFMRLVGRVMKSREAVFDAASLAKVFIALGASSGDGERRRGDEVVVRLAEVMSSPAEFLSNIDKRAFASALARLPLDRGGARHQLMETLAKTTTAALDDVHWWRGLEWSDLDILASGPLSVVAHESPGVRTMVAKVINEHAADVSTRSGLANLLAAPHFVFDWLTAESIAIVFERVASQDSLVRTWRNAVADEGGRAALNAEVENAHEAVRLARSNEQNAQAARDGLSQQLAAVQTELESIRDDANGLSARELRQVKIDAAKTIAQIAATVDGDGERLGHAGLVKKIGSLAERQGVSQDAERGMLVDFDAARHTAPGPRPLPGEGVVVARAGYTWSGDGEPIVILPALVARPTES